MLWNEIVKQALKDAGFNPQFDAWDRVQREQDAWDDALQAYQEWASITTLDDVPDAQYNGYYDEFVVWGELDGERYAMDVRIDDAMNKWASDPINAADIRAWAEEYEPDEIEWEEDLSEVHIPLDGDE